MDIVPVYANELLAFKHLTLYIVICIKYIHLHLEVLTDMPLSRKLFKTILIDCGNDRFQNGLIVFERGVSIHGLWTHVGCEHIGKLPIK